MTDSRQSELVAQAILRLGADQDWHTFVSGLEARYNTAKELLVSCDAGESELRKGEARALRSLLDDIRTARAKLERLDVSRRAPRGLDIP